MKSLTSSDWVGGRDEKWRTHLPGMEAMLGTIDTPLLDALRVDAPCRIAEIGCGGGGTALSLLRRLPKGTTVHGYDISPILVEHARARIPAGEPALAFEVADMAVTAPPPALYHRLVSRFGVMFFPDAPTAFRNLRRWLAPQGRVAFAVWAAPSDNPWILLTREVVSRIVEVPVMDPDAPGPFRYAEPARLAALLAEAGFTDIAAADWQASLPIGGGLPPEEAARFALAAFSSFAELLAAAGTEAQARAQRALAERYAGYERDGSVWLQARVNILSAGG